MSRTSLIAGFRLALALSPLMTETGLFGQLTSLISYSPYVVTTIAGKLPPPGGASLDGTGPEAQFAAPNGVAVDASGNVYVADTRTSSIRKISPGGVVTTLAGEGEDSYYAITGTYPATGVSGSVDGTGSSALFKEPRRNKGQVRKEPHSFRLKTAFCGTPQVPGPRRLVSPRKSRARVSP